MVIKYRYIHIDNKKLCLYNIGIKDTVKSKPIQNTF